MVLWKKAPGKIYIFHSASWTVSTDSEAQSTPHDESSDHSSHSASHSVHARNHTGCSPQTHVFGWGEKLSNVGVWVPSGVTIKHRMGNRTKRKSGVIKGLGKIPGSCESGGHEHQREEEGILQFSHLNVGSPSHRKWIWFGHPTADGHCHRGRRRPLSDTFWAKKNGVGSMRRTENPTTSMSSPLS